MPKVSVIMATYNSDKTICASVDSILKQSFEDWELIICDDASEDKTFLILEEYQKRHSQKIRLLRNHKRCFLAYSLNKCLAVASGEYIARMDADDISHPDRLKKQVFFLNMHPDYAVVGTAMTVFDENGVKSTRYLKPKPNKNDLLIRSPFAHATIMMRKKVYDAVGGYIVSERTIRGQDYDMWFRFYACGFKGYNLQEPLYLVLEDSSTYKRRTLKTSLYGVKTKLKGYKMLGYPRYQYVWALKPLVSAMIPVKIMQHYHKQVDMNSAKKHKRG